MCGYGESTVALIVYEVCCAIINRLWKKHVDSHMPQNSERYRQKIIDQEEAYQFPCAWAATDGCHLPIKCPPGGAKAMKEYFNFKGFYSIVLMGLVDTKYRFLAVSCGQPGNTHDAMILRGMKLWQRLDNIDPPLTRTMGTEQVPPLVLGDSAFPLRSWLMKPYTNAALTEKQKNYNYRLSRSRMVVEGAYGQLKGCWRELLKKGDSHKDTVKVMSLACIVLHNVTIDLNDKLNLNYDVLTQGRRDRQQVREQLLMLDTPRTQDYNNGALRIRDALCESVWLEKITGVVADNS